MWQNFRSIVIQLGYFKRDLSWNIYLTIILILFALHYLIVKNNKKFDSFKLALAIGSILFFSYNFLSHDFFNYMFDARIATFYHQNPYLFKALDFEKYGDTWLRFMHWTHRTYPYGPSWLALTLIPSFLSMGKLFLNFFLFKGLFVIFYLLSVFYLNKIDKEQALFFATNPLILIEGLVSPHNDLIAVSTAIIATYYLFKKKDKAARFILFFSAGIKYITLPLLFLKGDKKSKRNFFIFLTQVIILGLVCYRVEIQPWYFLSLFAFLPLFKDLVFKLNIFFFGLLLSYYPYIRLGGWDSTEKIAIKRMIIFIFMAINLLYLYYERKEVYNTSQKR